MRRVSFRVRDFDKEKFLTFNIDNEASLDEEVLDFLEDEEPKGIVPVIFEEDEEFDTFSYNITDKIRLTELLGQEINAEMVLKVLRGLALALIDMAEYRIPLSYLVLNRNYVYVDSDYKVDFVCIPLEEMQEDVDLNGFLRTFLASLRFDSSENGDYVAKILSYINNPAVFRLRNLVVLIEGFMSDMNIDIPEEDSMEIYAEYQEVEEEPESELESSTVSEEPQETIEEEQDLYDDTVTVFGGYDKEVISEKRREKMREEQKSVKEMLRDNETGLVDEFVPRDEQESASKSVTEPEQEKAEKLVMEPAQGKTEELVMEPVQGKTEELVMEPVQTKAEELVMEPMQEKVDESDMEDEQDSVNETVIKTEQDRIKKVIMKKVLEANGIEGEDDNDEIREEEETSDFAEDEDIQDGVLIEEEDIEETADKENKIKTKNTVTGVVIEDDFDDFMAEKELEDRMLHSEETGLKIKKNIKVNRVSIMQKVKEELAQETEKEPEEQENQQIEETEKEETITQEKAETKAKKGKNTKPKPVPKIKPYLIRVNTKERIMVMKQNFKIGKSGIGVDYTVEGNGAVSRVHAVITHKAEKYFIKDNKSTNHTYVNGEMVPDGDSVLLTHDCTIILGDEEFIFKFH